MRVKAIEPQGYRHIQSPLPSARTAMEGALGGRMGALAVAAQNAVRRSLSAGQRFLGLGLSG